MLEDLKHLYEMHNEELQQVLDNVTEYLLKSNKVFHKICKNGQALQDRNAVALVACDKFSSSISNILEIARKFNFHLFVNDLEKKSTRVLFEALDECERHQKNCNGFNALPEDSNTLALTASPPKSSDQSKNNTSGNNIKTECLNFKCEDQNVYDYKNLSIPPAEENNIVALNEQLLKVYLKKDLSKYEEGNILKASVSYIQDLEALNFFVCESESKEFQQIANLKSMVHLRQYTDIPPKNEVFGVVLDNTILRAIREEPLNTLHSDEEYTVLLLDFGEITVIDASNITYRLPSEVKNIPAQAIPCQLNGIYGQKHLSLKDLQARLQELEYEKATFVINSNQESICKLGLELITDEFKKKSAIPQNSTNVLSTTPNKKNAQKNMGNTNPFLTELSTTIDDNDEAIPLSALPDNKIFASEVGHLPNGLTPEEMDMLAEEPLNTSNAMIAVMGYNPKDEQRICRFYNPKTGACFKGANCRLEHTLLQPEGWTKDRIPAKTIIDNYFPMTRYTSGLIINITPTHVGQIEYFYAQINDPDNPMEPLIWTDDDIQLCMRLTKPPMLYDIVRARYGDERWYRAKIIDFDDSGKIFKVFYVDYGNHQNVSLKHLAYCDRSTERIPFQAILCRVADIMRNPEASAEQRESGVRTLNALILNHSLDVKVVNHYEDLIVRFMGAQYSQIPKRLISMGCAKQFHSNVANITK
ncbi:uncharacterized protein LOC118744841 [Rhagoletis pomonella]|uniref:uncharacterized protein LOC118744841 n=1 Tax=Rhagoletis pomonella TaxID=28610 RepID=UPI0017847FB9|nr:uncharacterized protein LOC118744841 [Rhagoletis pomonella]